MTWQNVINACLAIIMTLLVYQNTALQDQIAILETDIRIIKHTLEIPRERVQFEVIDTLSPAPPYKGVSAIIFQLYPSGLLLSSTLSYFTFLIMVEVKAFEKPRESIVSIVDVSFASAKKTPSIKYETTPIAVSPSMLKSTVLSLLVI